MTRFACVLPLCMAANHITPAAGQSNVDAAQGPGPHCVWAPPVTAFTIRVHSLGQLHDALRRAQTNTTILVEPGEYLLDRMLDLPTSGVTLRGATGDPAAVVLRGGGMLDRRVGVALSVSASDIAIADLTIRDVAFHGVQIRGEKGASRVRIHNIRVVDTGQQLIKGSTDGDSLHSDDVTVACSVFEYTDHAPTSYTNGIDVLGGRNWVVRDNRFLRIRGPASERFAAGPTILFWGNSIGTTVEHNTIIDSFRGIAFGLGPRASTLPHDAAAAYDHQGGWIRKNVIVNLNEWADEGIEANAADSAAIEHNTVITGGALPWSISLRFPQTTARARNNLTSKAAVLRDGAHATLEGNVSGATVNWFVNAAAADVRLVSPHATVIDAGAFEYRQP